MYVVYGRNEAGPVIVSILIPGIVYNAVPAVVTTVPLFATPKY